MDSKGVFYSNKIRAKFLGWHSMSNCKFGVHSLITAYVRVIRCLTYLSFSKEIRIVLVKWWYLLLVSNFVLTICGMDNAWLTAGPLISVHFPSWKDISIQSHYFHMNGFWLNNDCEAGWIEIWFQSFLDQPRIFLNIFVLCHPCKILINDLKRGMTCCHRSNLIF